MSETKREISKRGISTLPERDSFISCSGKEIHSIGLNGISTLINAGAKSCVTALPSNKSLPLLLFIDNLISEVGSFGWVGELKSLTAISPSTTGSA